MHRVRGVVSVWLCGSLAACDPTGHAVCALPTAPVDAGDVPPNVLLVVLDDVGVELIGAYGHPLAATTPTLDDLAAHGVRFDRAYAEPWCSPTRAELLTGRYAARFGLGRAIELSDPDVSLPDDVTSLPEVLATAPDAWRSAMFGKWHLHTLADGALDAPLREGFDHWSGTLGNLASDHASDGHGQDYFFWEQVTDGTPRRRRGYVTSATIDDASAWIDAQPTDAPWFVWLALHAAHIPFQLPPLGLHTVRGPDAFSQHGIVRATLEAADTELGRLLATMDPEVRARTVVIVVGDNGTIDNAGLAGFRNRPAKSTVYEAGVHVPLIIAGGPVTRQGTVSPALVHAVDLFPTIADLAAADVADLPLDGTSVVPYLRDPDQASTRTWTLATSFAPNGSDWRSTGSAMVRGPRFKLVRDHDAAHDALYDLGHAWLEDRDLTEGVLDEPARQGRADLREVLDRCLPP